MSTPRTCEFCLEIGHEAKDCKWLPEIVTVRTQVETEAYSSIRDERTHWPFNPPTFRRG